MAKILNSDLKKFNQSSIYSVFLRGKPLTKQDIVSELGLSLPTVTKNFNKMLDFGLITDCGKQTNTGGRQAVTYRLVDDFKVALGLDITKNHITIVIVDLMGKIISSNRRRIRFSASSDYYKLLSELVNSSVVKLNLKADQILGIGIGLPALVDKNRQSLIYSHIIDLSPTTYEDFSYCMPYKIKLFNDANAAAYTEIWNSVKLKNAFYLLLSNNIGGAIVVNDTVYQGDNQRSGEIGHVCIVPGGNKCYCGQRGCSDAYLSATNLQNMCNGNLSLFFENLNSGKPDFLAQWDKYLNYLAITVNTINVLFDCTVIIGGYVGGYIDPYLDELKKRVLQLSTFHTNADFIKACSYKQESIAAGAALSLITEFTESV